MINLNLNVQTKEWLLYGSIGGVFILILFSVYAAGIRVGHDDAELKASIKIVDLQSKLTLAEEGRQQAEIDLGECHAARAGELVLKCEEVCRERVSKAIQGVKELCAKP
jgi:hypothetical protein